MKEKKLILIAVEGKNNRTETLYFAHFGREQKEYTIRFVPCNETDPVQLVAHAEQMWLKEACDKSFGDRAFCVFDTDTDPGKQQKIEAAIRNAEMCEPILSNPCFEVWFLLHFSYTSRQFRSGSELIRELQKFVPAYSKSMDVFEKIQKNTIRQTETNEVFRQIRARKYTGSLSCSKQIQAREQQGTETAAPVGWIVRSLAIRAAAASCDKPCAFRMALMRSPKSSSIVFPFFLVLALPWKQSPFPA